MSRHAPLWHDLCETCTSRVAEHHRGAPVSLFFTLDILYLLDEALDPDRGPEALAGAVELRDALAERIGNLEREAGSDELGDGGVLREAGTLPTDDIHVESIDVTAPAIEVDEIGIVPIRGVLLVLAATVLKLAEDFLTAGVEPLLASGAPDAPEVAERIGRQMDLRERLDEAAAAHATCDTCPDERNMLRRAAHLLLAAQWTEPTGIPAQVLRALGMEMEDEDPLLTEC